MHITLISKCPKTNSFYVQKPAFPPGPANAKVFNVYGNDIPVSHAIHEANA